MHDRPLAEAAEESMPDSTEKNLGEVIRYLRREKDILEKEHELALQKAARLQGQVDHLQRSLDESRLALEGVILNPPSPLTSFLK